MFSVYKRKGLAIRAVVRKLRAFQSNRSGATAVEFGLVAMPFVLMVTLTINVGMYYYTINSLDKGAADAVRSILTGTAQTAGLTVGDFRTLVCNQNTANGSVIDCTKLTVLMASSTTSWSDLQTKIGPLACTTAGGLTASTGNATDLLSTYVNGQSAYVFVTLCYQWELAKYLPLFKTAAFTDGAMLIQSSIAIKTEPYS